MTGQRRPLGWAVLVGVLCAVILVGLGFARGTAAMTGVAHSERGPSSASFGTSTTVAAPSSDPDPSDVALPASSPRGSSRGLAVAPPVQVPVTPAVVAAAPQAVASGVVRQGAFCARDAVGQTGYTSSGTKMICTYGDGEDQPRWRADGPTQPKTAGTSKQQDQDQQDQERQDEEQQDEEEQQEPTTATTAKAPSSQQAQSI